MELSELELHLLRTAADKRIPAWMYKHLKDESRQAFDNLLSRGMVVLLSDAEYGATEEGREAVWDIEHGEQIPDDENGWGFIDSNYDTWEIRSRKDLSSGAWQLQQVVPNVVTGIYIVERRVCSCVKQYDCEHLKVLGEFAEFRRNQGVQQQRAEPFGVGDEFNQRRKELQDADTFDNPTYQKVVELEGEFLRQPQPVASAEAAAKRVKLSALMVEALKKLAMSDTYVTMDGAIMDNNRYLGHVKSGTHTALIDRKLVTMDKTFNVWRINDAGRSALTNRSDAS